MAQKISRRRVFYDQPSSVKGDLLSRYQQLGQEIDVKPAAIRALAILESDEKPFTPGGKPVVRFEKRHWRRNRRASRAALRFDSAPNPIDLDARWAQFEAMRAVQETPAILAHSFGMFQIMGFNYIGCLCADPVAFLRAMETVDGQFDLLKYLIQGSPDLLAALRRQDAPAVAKHFNGTNYAANQYDVRFASALKAGGSSVWA